MATRGSYVHKPYGKKKWGGGIPKMLVLCNFLKILMVSDKMLHKAFRTHTTLNKQNPLEKSFIFIYQNYTLALRMSANGIYYL